MSLEYGVAAPLRSVARPTAAKGVERTLARIRGEYREMPGLSLTAVQARRLFALIDLDLPMCEALLDRLVAEGFLRRNSTGVYCLASGS